MTQTKPVFSVRRQTEINSQRFGVYRDGKLYEGGFFSKQAAEELAANLGTLPAIAWRPANP